ncbi:MAG: CoA pyrophosphatase [Gammaproteobacteria bacterium]|nr:CoA pyrophosphatase [Gammaproteobacteria bacterium]
MRFDQKLREQIEKELAQFPVQRASAEKYAAVALIVTAAGIDPDISGIPAAENRQHDAALLLTRRSASLKRHAGQWALPGGRIDPGETELDAARREAVEEIGLSLGTDHYLGQLDDYVTRSGYVMTPLVFWIEDTTQLVLNPDEVASVHRIPVSEFLREDAPMLDYDELAEQHDTTNKRPVLRMPVGDNWIAAPTAAILYQFREVCLLNRHTRVAHFEQPVFAWS